MVPSTAAADGTASNNAVGLSARSHSATAAPSESSEAKVGTPDRVLTTQTSSAAPSAMAGPVEQAKGTAVRQVVLPYLLGKRPAETAFEV